VKIGLNVRELILVWTQFILITSGTMDMCLVWQTEVSLYVCSWYHVQTVPEITGNNAELPASLKKRYLEISQTPTWSPHTIIIIIIIIHLYICIIHFKIHAEKFINNILERFFQVRHPRCVEHKLKYNSKCIYNTVRPTLYFIRL
jgi:hypothetical protein